MEQYFHWPKLGSTCDENPKKTAYFQGNSTDPSRKHKIITAFHLGNVDNIFGSALRN